MQEAMKF